MPRIASAICYKIATMSLALMWEENQDIIFDPKNPLLAEIHAISSAVKPLATWNSDVGINMCREVCGGLGYSAYNRLGDLLQDNSKETLKRIFF
jgi:acyl-CoA oxidase